MARTQAHRHASVGTPLGDDVLLLRSFSGTEELGRPFEYHLDMLSEDHAIEATDMLGQNVTVRYERRDGETRYFNGYVSRFSQTGIADVEHERHLSAYEATVVPGLWFLTRTADCRIFQSMTVPEILKEIFQDVDAIEIEEALSGSYRTWEYCVQYRETDFNFVSRLMEQEGIYYFFEHHDGKHTMILSDSPTSHDSVSGYETIPYYPPGNAAARERDHISEWAFSRQVQPGSFALNDFDYEKPKKDLVSKASNPKDHVGGDLSIYDYPGEYIEGGDGESYARIRLEELHAQHETFEGGGDASGINTGSLFELTGNRRADQNKEYLVTSATHAFQNNLVDSGEGDDDTGYTVRFTAIDAQVPFRVARLTPKPVIQGPQTAIIVGKAGEEIWTDKHGRVKVKFHWDRYSKADENSSCWIRVAQSWAGKKWGAMFLPRIGQEVIIEFLEGDPDRPIITGRVYNGDATPPYDLPANATMSTIKSNSSKDGGGFNEFRFEDKKGEEQVFIHAEKNQDTRVKNDCFEWIGNNRHLIVKTDQLEHIENNRHEKVDADHVEEIGKDRHLKVKGKEAKEVGGSHSFTVKGDVIEVFKANHSEKTTQNYFVKAMGVVIEATSGITLKVGGSSIVINPSGVTIKGPLVTVDGGMTKINSGPGSPPTPGKAGKAVKPTAVTKAEEADTADPGEVAEIKAEQLKAGTGKYGSQKVVPLKAPDEESGEDEKKSWIEIELLDEDDQPVPGEKYKVTLPDGETVAEGTLDENGFARIEGIEPGNCKVTFPDRDASAWEPA